MKDLERLRDAGSEEDRALLREAARADLPPGFPQQVRQAVEGRLSPAGRRRAGWRLAGLGTLVAGSALAFGVVEIRARLAAPEELLPAGVPAAPASGPTPATPPAMPAPPALPSPPAARPAAPSGRPRSVFPSLGGPALTEPPGGEDPPASRVTPLAPSGRLVIAHEGRRPVSILLHGTRLRGEVRGQPVELERRGQNLVGKAADQPLSLVLLKRRQVKGFIAGQSVAFELSPTTEAGGVLRGNLPGLGTQVEIGEGRLSWYPGCDAPLTEAPTGSGQYRGRCHGGQVEVTISGAWRDLPLLERLTLLSLFLVEREPGLPDDPRTLFGSPDWPQAR